VADERSIRSLAREEDRAEEPGREQGRASSSRRPARCAPRARRMVNHARKSTPCSSTFTASGSCGRSLGGQIVVPHAEDEVRGDQGAKKHRFEREKDDHPQPRVADRRRDGGAPWGRQHEPVRETASHRRASMEHHDVDHGADDMIEKKAKSASPSCRFCAHHGDTELVRAIATRRSGR